MVSFKYISIVYILLFFQPAYAGECSEVLGKWVEKRFDNRLESSRVLESHYHDDGTYQSKAHYIGADGTEMDHHESGKWDCSHSIFIITPEIVDGASNQYETILYDILELNSAYFKLKPAIMNCEEILDECSENVVFENVRPD